ncbi:hypothetical protein [Heyndrickxia oleronia]|uniref:Uncharacterized protein n=1 Tax=Heyndrickxia oleronia TaxID=38875 RepID=A0AAW6T0A3_9BACI|nr:hypothetical protein [Heyndrickxia oleronia]MDH5163933.1 hypothetical protein [Heyndrickxia oleronia]
MFNEENFKDHSKKLEIKLVRSDDNLLTSWQISDFISQLTKHYYKNELLNTISLALKHGVSPNNIIIFEESFEINNSYSNIDGILDFTKPVDVKTFYHLGEPISMFPNEEIIKLNSTFSYFRKTNEILGKYNFSRINKNNLHYYYTMIKGKQPHKKIIGEIEALAKEIVKESSNKNEDISNFKENANKLTNDTLNKFFNYEKKIESLKILMDSIENNELEIFKNPNYQRLAKDYFNDFFTKFENLVRPIVGIYNNDTQKVQIFCQGFMNKAKHDPSRFLDLKRISHNSPYEAIFTFGIPIIIPLISVLNVALTSRRLETESEIAFREREETENRVIQTIQRLEQETDLEEIKAVEEIPQEYVKNTIKEIRQQNNLRFQEPIEKYGFVNCKIEVNIIEATSK